MILNLIIITSFTILVIKKSKYKSKYQYYLRILLEICFIILFLITAILSYLDLKKISSMSYSRKIIGQVFINIYEYGLNLIYIIILILNFSKYFLEFIQKNKIID